MKSDFETEILSLCFLTASSVAIAVLGVAVMGLTDLSRCSRKSLYNAYSVMTWLLDNVHS